MYVPRIFKPENTIVVSSYVKKYSFATLVSQKEGLTASHIPLSWHEDSEQVYITGHLSKANPLASSFDGGQELLAIFMNSHAYISSSWYDHVNVPTWNYIAVHIYGNAQKIDEQELYQSIEYMVEKYESNRPNQFKLSDFSDKELKAHLNGLIGFRMSINRVEAAYKLSQNRKDKDYSEIISQLRQSGTDLEQAIANEMEILR